MSVIVLAYHEMGFAALQVLLERRAPIAAVFTYDDDPAETPWFGSVARVARDAGLAVHTTERINDREWVELIASLQTEVIFSFHYRHILGKTLLQIPARGCVNLHPSLLPRFRGRAPINWQLVHGVTESGVTLHYMAENADAGDIIDQEPVPVDGNDTALDLYQKLIPGARRLIDRHLDGILDGTAPRRAQDESRATGFGRRRPEDGRIDWERPAREIHNLVRAVAPPWPGAFSDGPTGRLRVMRTRLPRDTQGLTHLKPGEILAQNGHTFVGAGDGPLELVETGKESR